MLIEYKIVFGKSGVTVSQRVESCCSTKGESSDSGVLSTTLWRSLGKSYGEALGGSGLESTAPPGGGDPESVFSGLESTGTGGTGLESTGTGGTGLESTGTGGTGLEPTGTGGTGLESTGTGGAA